MNEVLLQTISLLLSLQGILGFIIPPDSFFSINDTCDGRALFMEMSVSPVYVYRYFRFLLYILMHNCFEFMKISRVSYGASLQNEAPTTQLFP